MDGRCGLAADPVAGGAAVYGTRNPKPDAKLLKRPPYRFLRDVVVEVRAACVRAPLRQRRGNGSAFPFPVPHTHLTSAPGPPARPPGRETDTVFRRPVHTGGSRKRQGLQRREDQLSPEGHRRHMCVRRPGLLPCAVWAAQSPPPPPPPHPHTTTHRPPLAADSQQAPGCHTQNAYAVGCGAGGPTRRRLGSYVAHCMCAPPCGAVLPATAFATGETLAVKPGKVVAGRDAELTNLWLQAVAGAASSGVRCLAATPPRATLCPRLLHRFRPAGLGCARTSAHLPAARRHALRRLTAARRCRRC